jgi:hypothetical protein
MAEQSPSLADELRKLADLKKDGVLSEEEFATAKAALLSPHHAGAPPETAVRTILLNGAALAAAVRTPSEAKSTLTRIAGMLDAEPRFAQKSAECAETSRKLRALAEVADGEKVLKACLLVAQKFEQMAKYA